MLRIDRRLKNTRDVAAVGALVRDQTRLVDQRRDGHDFQHRFLAARARRQTVLLRLLSLHIHAWPLDCGLLNVGRRALWKANARTSYSLRGWLPCIAPWAEGEICKRD